MSVLRNSCSAKRITKKNSSFEDNRVGNSEVPLDTRHDSILCYTLQTDLIHTTTAATTLHVCNVNVVFSSSEHGDFITQWCSDCLIVVKISKTEYIKNVSVTIWWHVACLAICRVKSINFSSRREAGLVEAGWGSAWQRGDRLLGGKGWASS